MRASHRDIARAQREIAVLVQQIRSDGRYQQRPTARAIVADHEDPFLVGIAMGTFIGHHVTNSEIGGRRHPPEGFGGFGGPSTAGSDLM
jgi:hypothetical protein